MKPGGFETRPCGLCGGWRVVGSRVGDSGVGEHAVGEGQGEAYDVGVVAADPFYEGCGPALDGVASGFADALAVAGVGIYLGGAEPSHLNRGDGVTDGEVVVRDDGDARVDLVGAVL